MFYLFVGLLLAGCCGGTGIVFLTGVPSLWVLVGTSLYSALVVFIYTGNNNILSGIMAVSIICVAPIILQDVLAAQTTGQNVPDVLAYFAGANWPKALSAVLLLLTSYTTFVLKRR